MTEYLEDVLDGLEGRRDYSGYTVGLCPFHDDTRPSMRVSEKGFHCWACGKSGSLKTLAKRLKRGIHTPSVSSGQRTRTESNIFPVYENLAELKNFLLEAHDRLMTTERLMWYLKHRGVESMAVRCLLGWSEEHYTFPIFDVNSGIIGATARVGSQSKAEHKYLVPSGQPPLLYVPDRSLWSKSNRLYVTFGILDAITLAMLGYAAASPSSGKNSFRPEWLNGDYRHVYFVPDEGEKDDAVYYATKLGWRGNVFCFEYPEGCKDVNDLMMVGQRQVILDRLP